MVDIRDYVPPSQPCVRSHHPRGLRPASLCRACRRSAQRRAAVVRPASSSTLSPRSSSTFLDNSERVRHGAPPRPQTYEHAPWLVVLSHSTIPHGPEDRLKGPRTFIEAQMVFLVAVRSHLLASSARDLRHLGPPNWVSTSKPQI